MQRQFPGSCAMRSLALAAVLPALAHAQSGRIVGVVTDSRAQPLTGAQVLVPTAGLATESGADGAFIVRGVPAGTYALRVYRLGFKPRDVAAVAVTHGSDTRVSIVLEPAAIRLGGIVVSASRRVEKITDAPATVTRLDAAQFENTVGNSFAPALKQVNGIEFIQVGINSVAMNARGFNSSFNNRMLMMEDGRIATLPESGLPVGAVTTIPKLDLSSLEVLVGPGAALYGPDASNGVVTLTTKDPRQSQGWATEVSGGSRNFFDVQGRYAKAAGRLAGKLSAEYQRADDFTNAVFYPAVSAGGQPIAEKNPDFHTDIARASGSLAWYLDDASRLNLTAGASRLRRIFST